jgi:hypothetical protein
VQQRLGDRSFDQSAVDDDVRGDRRGEGDHLGKGALTQTPRSRAK